MEHAAGRPWGNPLGRNRPRERQHARLINRERAYIDDELREPEGQHGMAMQSEARSRGELEDLKCESLIASGVDASTTDHGQGVGNTLCYTYSALHPMHDLFWSSTGSDTEEDMEYLTYKLRYPSCTIHSVRIQVYRATYQPGEPIYPPSWVMIEVGPSMSSLHPVTGWMKVRVESTPQTFHLPAGATAGQYVRVRMRNKPQKQLEDLRHYIAIHRVWVFGWKLDPRAVVNRRLLGLSSPNSCHVYNGTHLSTHSLMPPRMALLAADAAKAKEGRSERLGEDEGAWVVPPVPAGPPDLISLEEGADEESQQLQRMLRVVADELGPEAAQRILPPNIRAYFQQHMQ